MTSNDVSFNIGVSINKNSVNEVKSQIKSIETEVTNLGTKYNNALSVSKRGRQSDVLAWRKDVKDASAEVTNFNQHLETYNAQLEELTASENAYKQALKDRNNTQSRLNTAVAGLENTKTAYTKGDIDADKYQAKKTSYEDKIKAETEKLNAQEQEVARLKQEYDNVHTSVSQTEDKLNESYNKIKQAEGPAGELSTRFSTTTKNAEATANATAKTDSNTKATASDAAAVQDAFKNTATEATGAKDATKGLADATKETSTSSKGNKVADVFKDIRDKAVDSSSSVLQIVQKIAQLRSDGQDASSTVALLGTKLEELGTTSTNIGLVSRTVKDLNSALTYIGKTFPNAGTMDDAFNSISATLVPQKQLLNELNASLKTTGNTYQQTAQKAVSANQQTSSSLGDLVLRLSTYRTQLENAKATGQSTATIEKNLATTIEQVNSVLSVPLKNTSYPQLISLVSQLQSAFNQLKTNGVPTNVATEFGKISQKLTQAKSAVSAYEGQFKKTKSSTKSGADVMKSALSNITPVIKDLKSNFKGMTSTIKNIKSNFTGMASNMKSNFKSLITSVTKYVLGFRSLFFLVRRLRNYVGQGIQNLAQWNDGNNEVNDSITDMLTSLLYLKNSWAAAFSPIITTVRPYLTSLIDKLAEASNMMAQFLTTITSAITGNTSAFQAVKVQAEDYADSLDDTSDSASGASDAVDDLTDRLAAFDDLNVLGVDDEDSGSGGSGGSDTETYEPDVDDMFTIVDAVSELGEMIKNAFMTDWDFTEVGEEISTRIVDFLQTGIDWTTIQSYAVKVGRAFGSFISGLFGDSAIWEAAGTTLARGLNTISITIKSFLTETEGTDFGGNFAKGINAFFDRVEWTTIFDNIVNAVTQLRDNVISFLQNLNWKGEMDSTGNMTGGIFEVFEGLGTTIGQIISETLGDEELMTWIANGLGNLANALILALQSMLDELDGEDLGSSIYAFFQTLFDTVNWEDLSGVISDGIIIALQAITTLSDKLAEDDTLQQSLKDFITNLNLDGVFEALGENISSSTVAATSIANALVSVMGSNEVNDGILDGITTLISNIDIVELVDSAVELITNLLTSAFLDPMLPIKIAGAIIDGLITGLANAIVDKGIELGDFFYDAASTDSSLVGVDNWWDAPAQALVSGLAEGIDDALLELFDPIVSPFKYIYDSFCELFDINSPSKVFEELGGFLVQGLLAGIDALMPDVEQIFTDFSGFLETSWETIQTNAETWWGDIKGSITTKAGEIRTSVGEKVTALKTSLAEKWSEIKSDASEKLTPLITTMTDIFNRIQNAIKPPINGIITAVESLVNKMLLGINNFIDLLNDMPDMEFTNPFTGTNYTLGFNIPRLSYVHLPRLAQGAVIPPNKEFMAVLGDQKSGTNIEAPLDTIKQAVAEELSEQIGVLQEGFASVVQAINSKELAIGDKQIGQASARYNAQQARIRGVNW